MDYRYLPDPNIPPLLIDQAFIQRVQEQVPELDSDRRSRLVEMILSGSKANGKLKRTDVERDVDVLLNIDVGRSVGWDGAVGGGTVEYFEEVVKGAKGRDPKTVLNW